MSAGDDHFSEQQKRYLEGFVSGSELVRSRHGLATFAETLAARGIVPDLRGKTEAEPIRSGPDAIHLAAQDRLVAAGETLSAEERAKREKNALDMWDEMVARAGAGEFPKGADVFRYKFHGLFHVAPAQNAFMCRLRFPGGMLSAHQLRGVARIAADLAGGYAHVTTRANLQLREIGAGDAIEVLTALHDLGIVNRGAGADNIRNITGSPTAGIDPAELIDTRPLTRRLHHAILNHRELYGLPRKFNIAFDGGGATGVLEDTNDIGFAAVHVRDGSANTRVAFRMLLGGITGHGDFAADTGVLLEPDECVPVAIAVVRVFIEHGDRTDRKRARLKYLLDRWGIERFLEETERQLGRALPRTPLEECEAPPPAGRGTHIGFHPQKQDGLCWLGVVLPVGRLEVAQMEGLARVAETCGSGSIRLTVWQNLIISDLPLERVEDVKREIEALGLDWKATSFRAGLVACTGNRGCKYSASDTKGHAMEIAGHLESRLELDQPLNIHLTGCPHSCAQHFIGDIGLLGASVEDGDELVEGYDVFVGGGFGPEREIGRLVYRGVPAREAPSRLERMVRAYLDHRVTPDESFADFTRRQTIEELLALFEDAAASRTGEIAGASR